MANDSVSSSSRKVPCPRCKTLCIFDKSQNPFRPFCSERCQLIDLGNWASEDYRVPVAPQTPEELEQLLEKMDSDNSDEGLPQ